LSGSVCYQLHAVDSCLAYTLIPNIDVTWSSETSVHFQQATRCYNISEDITVQGHQRENLKFFK
jgi:hypothetical protein